MIQKIHKRIGFIQIMWNRFFVYLTVLFLSIYLTGCDSAPLKNDSKNNIYIQGLHNKEYYQHIFSQVKDLKQITRENKIWGVTVPHHMLASDIIAKTLIQLKSLDKKLIFILSPDHFNRGKTKITIANINFRTPFGEAKISQKHVRVFSMFEQVSINNNLFSLEHGFSSILPFAYSLWSDAEFFPILIRSDAREKDMEEIIKFLGNSFDDSTLIIQSSDFSHYLSFEEANKKDQETLNTVRIKKAEDIWNLQQPDHCDAINILYTLKKIQENTKSSIEFFINKNSQNYNQEKIENTTSYITFYLSKHPLQIIEPEKEILFGGDFFTGRSFLIPMRDETFRIKKAEEILKKTKNRTLVVNFEGYLCDICALNEPLKLCMETNPTIDFMKKLNISLVSLANNHSLDGGINAYEYTKEIFKKNNIQYIENLETENIIINKTPVLISTFTDIEPRTYKKNAIYKNTLSKVLLKIENLDTKKNAIKILFPHWGKEYSNTISERENAILRELSMSHLSLIVGSHTHKASNISLFGNIILLFSLGNFFFDQTQEAGNILRIQFFDTGNMAVSMF